MKLTDVDEVVPAKGKIDGNSRIKARPVISRLFTLCTITSPFQKYNRHKIPVIINRTEKILFSSSVLA